VSLTRVLSRDWFTPVLAELHKDDIFVVQVDAKLLSRALLALKGSPGSVLVLGVSSKILFLHCKFPGDVGGVTALLPAVAEADEDLDPVAAVAAPASQAVEDDAFPDLGGLAASSSSRVVVKREREE
jgi:hypothetical protein